MGRSCRQGELADGEQRSLSRPPGHAPLVNFHHLPKVENRWKEKETDVWFSFCLQRERGKGL